MVERRQPAKAFYTRRQVAALFDVSIATLTKMEADGVLTPVRLRPSKPHSPVLYRRSEVDAIINGEAVQ